MSSIDCSNSLADLAARIRSYHEATIDALKHSVEYAMDAGDLLVEAKGQVPHGQWLPWLQDHCRITERMAQRYMRLSRNRDTIQAKSDTVSDLTINGALALLTVPSTAEKVVAAAEASEAVHDKAEAARRQVIFDAIERNGDAIVALAERLGVQLRAADFKSDYPWLNDFFDELLETVANNGKEYELAVECGDHARAFALVSWAHDLSVDMRSMVEEIPRGKYAQLAGERS